MLKTRLIPCLDVNDGRVVKGVNFVNLVDAGDPAEQARIYDEAGADELWFLDIAHGHYDIVIVFQDLLIWRHPDIKLEVNLRTYFGV